MGIERKTWNAKAREQTRRIRRQHEFDHPENPVMTDAQIESAMFAWAQKPGNTPPPDDLRRTVHDVCKAVKQSDAFHPTINQGKGFKVGLRFPTSDDAALSTALVGLDQFQAYCDLGDLEDDADDAVKAERRHYRRTRLPVFKANPHLKLPEIERLFGYEGPLTEEPYKPMEEVELLPEGDDA